MPTCTDCGGTVIEYDTAAGNGFCVKCGTVVEENTIVNEITFGETSAGAAMIQGAFVGQGATHARITGPYGNRGGGESREQTIANASRKIQSIANILRLSEMVCLAATRMYTLAVEHKFTKGRKSMNVVAVCLYVACRQKETRNYMLIDFSDLLQVNVFELGHTYLQLVQTLNLRLPLVDPSHYISRFSALLEFGDETNKVATDAVRLVQRFDRDWMTRGRRPAGICGAALLLAARMNNFRRSVEEIVQVVKIADTTLKKRLDEFKASPSGQLTMADFRSVWLEEECDPPAFVKNREQDKLAEEEGYEAPQVEETWDDEKELEMKERIKKKSKKKKKKRKREYTDDGEEAMPEESLAPTDVTRPDAIPFSPVRIPIDPSLLNEGILEGMTGTLSQSEVSPDADIPTLAIDAAPSTLSQPSSAQSERLAAPPLMDPIEETVSNVLTEEVTTFLETSQGASLASALDEAEQRRLSQINENIVDELLGLDEEELDLFLLTEEEVKIKERVWVEINRDYLEALAAKGDQAESGTAKSRKRRKTSAKPRDASTPHGQSAADSVRKMLKKNPKYSKRINYDALKDLFVEGVDISPFEDNKDDDDKDDDDNDNDNDDDSAPLYTMDDKSDGEMVIIQEEAGSVHVPAGSKKSRVMDDDEPDPGDEETVGWEDPYEQEV